MANNLLLSGGAFDFHDRFDGPVIAIASNVGYASKCRVQSGTGTLTVTRLALNGGAVRLTGDTNEAADFGLFGPLAYEPDECGLLTLNARLRINGNGSVLTATSTFIGFSDADDDSLGLNYEDGAVVSTPTDGFGILLEPEQNAGWYTIGTGNSTDDTVAIDTSIDSYVRAAWVSVRIEAVNRALDGTVGTVVRYRSWVNGKLLLTAATDRLGWVTSLARSSITYCPAIFTAGRATAYTTDICEFAANGGTGATLD